MKIVTLEDALRQLRRNAYEDDHHIRTCIADAEDWAIGILGQNYDEEWTVETVPPRIRRAVLCYISAIYDDDPDGKYLDLANRQIEFWRDHTLA